MIIDYAFLQTILADLQVRFSDVQYKGCLGCRAVCGKSFSHAHHPVVIDKPYL